MIARRLQNGNQHAPRRHLINMLAAILAIGSLFVTMLILANEMAALISCLAMAMISLGAYLGLSGRSNEPVTARHADFPSAEAMSENHQDGGAVVFAIANFEQIIAEKGVDALEGLVAHIGELMSVLTAGRTMYRVNTSTIAYPCSADCELEIDLLTAASPLITTALRTGKNGVDLHVHAGICFCDGVTMAKAVNRAIVASRRAAASGVLWERWCAKGDGAWPISIGHEFARSLENGDLWLAYQPKYDANSHDVMGAEALIRWNHPERGQICPDDFIPLIERTGQMAKLTRFVIEKSVSDFSIMPQSWDVAVNIAPSLLGSGNIHDCVESTLARHSFPARRLVLEITENACVDEAGIAEIAKLRSLGVGVAIDDYGIGYSTMAHLRALPATQIKLDKSLVQQMTDDEKGKLIIVSAVRLAHQMGLKVVAEGAELEAHLKFLTGVGVDLIQGYALGRPMPIDQLKGLIARPVRAAAICA